MIAPRVQPIGTLPDNEPGRCSSWIARQPGHASFYDRPPTLPSCRFARAQLQQPLPVNDYRSLDPCAERSSYDDRRRVPTFESLAADVETLAYQDACLPCAELSSAFIEQLQSELQPQCSQFRDCPQNLLHRGAKSCQLGPVDVEDLALYFEQVPDKLPSINCPARVYRPSSSSDSSSSSSNFRRSKSTRYDSPYPSFASGKRLERSGFSSSSSSSSELLPPFVNWLDEREFCDDCPQPFAFCTEKRWLQCPASDRCPLYDNACSYGQNVLPPCLLEDLRNEYRRYDDDEQLLEYYLSNEKRKEKSRDAARCRRSKETDIFTELAAALPVPPEQAAHLDKASVMRLAIAYLKVRSVVDSIPGTKVAKSETLNQMDELFSKALNGFMLVLSSDGNMIYLSENVSDYLGVCQMDMMGQSVYEYSHPCDHEELRECLSSKPPENNDKRTCSFFLRLKCTLTSKGRKVNLKSASYKVIHCTGRLTYIRDPASSRSNETNENAEQKRDEGDEENERDTGTSLVLLGCPIPHPSNIEIPLGRHTFLSKHSLSMKFTYADEKLAEYLGWDSEELVGQSVFEFHHALDNLALDKSFKSLFSKGQCETVAYRFLGKRGGYAWVVTQATLIHCTKQQKPLSVVCVNYILSGVEREDEVYSARQLAARDTENKKKPVKPKKEPAAANNNNNNNNLTVEQTTAKLRIRVQVNNNNNDDDDDDNEKLVGDEQRFSPVAAQPEPTTTATSAADRAKPLTVTSSTFRAADNKPRKEPVVQPQDGSRKDNTFPRPVHQPAEKSFAGVKALEESLKENDEPKRNQHCRQQSAASRAPFVFQGKPAVEYEQETAVRQDRPHVVTRHLFASITTQQQQQQQEQITCRPPPQTATASIFAPRTEDMNKGFLTFSEDHPGLTMLKDEPEDLTHLAPTPGDVCVPLEDTPFLSDMLDEFILGSDNYCPLLSPDGTLAPELRATDFTDTLKDAELGDTTRNKDLGESLADSDPFMYGDSPSSPCSIDPSAVSPPFTKYRQSPERSIDSLGSPAGGSGADGLSEDEMLMLGLNDSIADDELELRAPYIPMSDQDEALDLLISNDMVMWSPPQTTDHKSCPKWLLTEKEQRTADSSLAQLLKTDQVSRKYNDHGGGLVNPVQVLGQIPRKNINLDNCHWSSRVDRPAKRIHTASIDTGNDNKRIKCDDQSAKRNCHLGLEDHLLIKQQPSSRKSSNNIGNSQLLRRLVSQQNVLRSNFTNESFDERTINGRQSVVDRRRVEEADHLDVEDGEGDSGGGGGGGGGGINDGGGRKCETSEARCRRNVVAENGDAISQISQRNNPACNSVLMNLLVSGCDENLMDSRNVPSNVYLKSLMSPLSVSLENHQMVPQCPDSRGSSCVSFDSQLSPAARKQLPATFSNVGSIVSPTSSLMVPYDSFDYEPSMSASGLLQVEPDLFGTLLDRDLV